MTLNFFLFSSMSFLGTSKSYFFPPTILLTLHEISLYFAITTQNTLKWIQNSRAFSLSFFLSLFSLCMKFPYILTLITKNTLKMNWKHSLFLSPLSLLSILIPIFFLSYLYFIYLLSLSCLSPLFYLFFSLSLSIE